MPCVGPAAARPACPWPCPCPWALLLLLLEACPARLPLARGAKWAPVGPPAARGDATPARGIIPTTPSSSSSSVPGRRTPPASKSLITPMPSPDAAQALAGPPLLVPPAPAAAAVDDDAPDDGCDRPGPLAPDAAEAAAAPVSASSAATPVGAPPALPAPCGTFGTKPASSMARRCANGLACLRE